MLTETLENRTALAVMAAYLTGTDVSPMKKSFVNIPKPLATSVSIGPNSKLEPALSMAFGNVPVEKIDEIEPKFKQVIQQLVDDGPEKFEIKTIHLICKLTTVWRRNPLSKRSDLILSLFQN